MKCLMLLAQFCLNLVNGRLNPPKINHIESSQKAIDNASLEDDI